MDTEGSFGTFLFEFGWQATEQERYNLGSCQEEKGRQCKKIMHSVRILEQVDLAVEVKKQS